MLWSRPLETKCGQAINPFTKEAFYGLLGDTVTKYNISEDQTWGLDEIGIQGSMGMPERVMGACKLGLQYQQRDGDKKTSQYWRLYVPMARQYHLLLFIKVPPTR